MNYGLDYGTTTSLFWCYQATTDHQCCQMPLAVPSAVIVADGKIFKEGVPALEYEDDYGMFIESPKYAFRNNRLDDQELGVQYRQMIAAIIRSLLTANGNIEQDSHITITVPNIYIGKNYNDMRRIVKGCLDSHCGSGHNITIHMIPEPVAAALYYAYKYGISGTTHIVICDIGGGTTDMCIVRCTIEGKNMSFEVMNGSQHAMIGGNNFDDELLRSFGADKTGLLNKHRLRVAIKRLKIQLSTQDTGMVSEGDVDLVRTRDEFNARIFNYLRELAELMKDMRKKSGLNVDGTWKLLPIGGSCHIPAIRARLRDVFSEAEMINVEENENKDIFDSVVRGAALYSAIISNEMNGIYGNINIKNTTPHAYEYFGVDNCWHVIVPQNSPDCEEYIERIKIINPKIEKKCFRIAPILLRERGGEPWTLNEDNIVKLELKDRSADNIVLSLKVVIKDCHIKSCSIIDDYKGLKEYTLREWKI